MRRLLVVGTGQMGPGIALSAARGGCQVTLYARSDDSLARGMANWRAALDYCAATTSSTPTRRPAPQPPSPAPPTSRPAARAAEWVIESIAEDLATKHELYGRLDSFVRAKPFLPATPLACAPPTSARPPARPTQVLTTHFWNPPALMELVEVVPGEVNDPAIAQRVLDALN